MKSIFLYFFIFTKVNFTRAVEISLMKSTFLTFSHNGSDFSCRGPENFSHGKMVRISSRTKFDKVLNQSENLSPIETTTLECLLILDQFVTDHFVGMSLDHVGSLMVKMFQEANEILQELNVQLSIAQIIRYPEYLFNFETIEEIFDKFRTKAHEFGFKKYFDLRILVTKTTRVTGTDIYPAPGAFVANNLALVMHLKDEKLLFKSLTIGILTAFGVCYDNFYRQKNSSCFCELGKRCLMEWGESSIENLSLSSCTKTFFERDFSVLRHKLGTSTSKSPTTATVCGNNKVEKGEDCDCGSTRECEFPCDIKTCLAKVSRGRGLAPIIFLVFLVLLFSALTGFLFFVFSVTRATSRFSNTDDYPHSFKTSMAHSHRMRTSKFARDHSSNYSA